MKYKMILFDADETLFDFSKAEKYALERTMEDNQVVYVENDHLPLYKELNVAIWKELERGEITQQELKVERFKRFLDAIQSKKDPQQCSDGFLSHLADAKFLIDGVEELLENLAQKYRLIVVTNGLTRVQKYRVRGSIIARFFERIIISEEIGYSKPNPMFFIKGLEGITLPDKSEIVIVGDSLTSDIAGGINFGIDTILYNPQQKDKSKDITPDYEIHKLEMLYHIL